MPRVSLPNTAIARPRGRGSGTSTVSRRRIHHPVLAGNTASRAWFQRKATEYSRHLQRAEDARPLQRTQRKLPGASRIGSCAPLRSNDQVERRAAAPSQPKLLYPDSSIPFENQRRRRRVSAPTQVRSLLVLPRRALPPAMCWSALERAAPDLRGDSTSIPSVLQQSCISANAVGRVDFDQPLRGRRTQHWHDLADHRL